MGVSFRIRKPMSLHEFLRMPGIDEHPSLEYIDGRIDVLDGATVLPEVRVSVGEIFRALIRRPPPTDPGRAPS
jgi:hypothetical protein